MGGLIGGSTSGDNNEAMALGNAKSVGWFEWECCAKTAGHARRLSRQHFYFAREGKPLKEVVMLGERMCNLHSIRLGDLVHCDIPDPFLPLSKFLFTSLGFQTAQNIGPISSGQQLANYWLLLGIKMYLLMHILVHDNVCAAYLVTNSIV